MVGESQLCQGTPRLPPTLVAEYRATGSYLVTPEPTGTPRRLAHILGHEHPGPPVAVMVTVGDVLSKSACSAGMPGVPARTTQPRRQVCTGTAGRADVPDQGEPGGVQHVQPQARKSVRGPGTRCVAGSAAVRARGTGIPARRHGRAGLRHGAARVGGQMPVGDPARPRRPRSAGWWAVQVGFAATPAAPRSHRPRPAWWRRRRAGRPTAL